MPIEYYDPIILSTIGNRIGKTIKVDKTTSQVEMGKYARICVELELSKPLLTMFTIKEKMYKIEYEGLHLLCLSYGRFGHYKEGCPNTNNIVNLNTNKGGNVSAAVQRNGELEQCDKSEGHGKLS